MFHDQEAQDETTLGCLGGLLERDFKAARNSADRLELHIDVYD